jgi:DNA-binding MarR family transcriptional regulator
MTLAGRDGVSKRTYAYFVMPILAYVLPGVNEPKRERDNMTGFRGFDEPNYTQTPNQFFDEILFRKDTTFGESKLLLFMIRFTFGWQNSRAALQFSITDIMEYTNMSRGVASKAIQDCLKKEYIERVEKDGDFHYRLKMSGQGSWDNVVDWKSRQPKVHKSVRKSNQSEGGSEIELVRKSNRNQFGNRTSTSSEIEPVNNDRTQTYQGYTEHLKKDLKKDKEKDIYEFNTPDGEFPFYNWLDPEEN